MAVILCLLLAGTIAAFGQTGEEISRHLRNGLAHLQRGEANLAVRECKAALALDPQSAAAHMLLGQAYLAARSVTLMGEAKGELQEALHLDPHLLWARFYLAKAYIDLGKYDKAKDELQRGLAERANVPHFLALLGEVNRKLGNPQASLELNRQALAADANLTPAHYHLALAYLDMNREDDAIRELQISLRSPYVAPEMYLTLGSLYTKRRRFAEAEEVCRKAIALDPARPEGYLNLGQLYNVQGMSGKALEALGQAFPEGRTFPATAYYQGLQADVFFEMGRAYQARRQSAQAIRAYSRSLELDPSRDETRRALAAAEK
jgi:tetratricopeptide (TPR) repeat protein